MLNFIIFQSYLRDMAACPSKALSRQTLVGELPCIFCVYVCNPTNCRVGSVDYVAAAIGRSQCHIDQQGKPTPTPSL